MTVYTWPDGRAYRPASVDWQELDNDRSSTSQLTGSVQTVAIPGVRQAVTLNFPRQHVRERRALEALIRRLNGSEHRALVSIPQLEYRYTGPQGNWTPSGVTMGGAAAQFANSLTLSGCYGINLTKNPQDFSAATWSKSGGVTVTANTADTLDPFGGSGAERIDITSGGGRFISEASFWASLNTDTYKWRSVYAKAGTVWRVIFEGWSNTAFDLTALTGPGGAVIEDVGNGWRRCSMRTTATIGNHAVYLDVIGTAVNAGYLYLYGGQTYRGATLPPYTPYAEASAGDWLQVPTATGNQLVQVVADATANDAGAMTVEVRPMLRGSVASGAAVELASPSALFRLARRPTFPREQGGWCGAFSVDLVEAFS